MKKIILSLLVALMATTGANAQETLTVYEDASVYSEYVPVNGWNADSYLKCEFVIPATEISAMEGGTISQMTFYLKQSATKAWTGTFQVFLKEVNSTTINAYSGTEGATTVYTGTLDATGSTMTIPFSTIYTYRGGNLLVGIYETAKGNDERAYFYGVTATGASGQYLDSFSLDAVTFVQKDFLPKTTFTYNPVPAGPTTSGIDWNPSTNSGTFLMPAYDVEVSTELWYILKQNGETPDGNKTKANVFLDRTLQSLPGDNKGWNTFCAPFDISAEKVSALGMTVKAFTGSTLSGGTLTLHFETASSIAAGTPYLVQVASNLNFAADGNEFAGVTQDWTAHNATSTYADFLPVLEPTVLYEGDKTVLFVYGGNELGHPSVTGNILGFRAYFQLKGDAASVKAFAMSFDDEVATGIGSLTPNPSPVGEGSVYTLDGRKVNGQPTRKGVYVVNGKKVIK